MSPSTTPSSSTHPSTIPSLLMRPRQTGGGGLSRPYHTTTTYGSYGYGGYSNGGGLGIFTDNDDSGNTAYSYDRRGSHRRRRRLMRHLTLLLGTVVVVYCVYFLFWAGPASASVSSTVPITDSTTTTNSKSESKPESDSATTTAAKWTLKTPGDKTAESKGGKQHSPPPKEVLRNLSLTAEQCDAYFPGLTKEVDEVVKKGPFEVRQQTSGLGPLQGRIEDGQIYILHAQRKSDISTEMLNSRTASLHQLHRALVTWPSTDPNDPIPDTIFTLNFQDQPFGTAWTYSRHADPDFTARDSPNKRNFLMPHFSFWAWDLPFIGSMSRAARAIDRLEGEYLGSRWRDKIPKAVWRGTTWFNSISAPGMRQKLVSAARGKPWADVEPLEWGNGGGNGNATNALAIEEFCRYKYVVHTEGVTYSGRFQFLQMCASVVLTPPILWMQHVTHLVKPLFSNELDLGKDVKRWTPTPGTKRAWPVSYPPEEANIVFVAPDWSDLGDTVAWLEAHPEVAEGIARRQRELFVGGGYFSPAAETCYWRALVRGWAKMARTEGQGWEEVKGVPFETFIFKNTLE
ncbi:hypothetical protein VTJ04DRAFT_9703 [Mycothermus thermophilus]|uniref:uncharacterized protein n=1 Tax=Humicola insolens TaxID=85995 RepID=UPI003742D2A4